MLLLILFFIAVPVIGQEISEETPKEEVSVQESNYAKWLYTFRGYGSTAEFRNNNFNVLSLRTPQIFAVNYKDKHHRLGIGYSVIDKHKNNFYLAMDMNFDFVWNRDFSMIYDYYAGFGRMFLDSRDELGKGWLVGMDIGFGSAFPLVSTIDRNHFDTYLNAGIHFRGIYKKAESRVGFSVSFGALYRYSSNRHAFALTPSIGLVF